MVDIKEKTLVGKRPDQSLCEDGIFANDNFVAVIDGVSSKGTQKWQGKFTSGCYAKEIIIRELERMPRDIGMEDFFKTLDAALFDAYKAEAQTDDIADRLRACIVVYSDHHSQIWAVGDCACMINGKLFQNHMKVDSVMSELRSFIIYSALKNGSTESDIKKDDIGRTAVAPFIKMQHAFENDFDTPFGYFVLNGHGFDIRGCKTYDVIRGDTVILASDGYPKLCNTLEESENKLKEILETDPLCYKTNICTKGLQPENASFDDRSFIKFVVS